MSVKIHGKNYITVAERVNEFHGKYPNGSIQTELVKFQDGVIITKTHVYPDMENSTRKFKHTFVTRKAATVSALFYCC